MHFCISGFFLFFCQCVEISVLGDWSSVKSQPQAKNVPHSLLPPAWRFKSSQRVQFNSIMRGGQTCKLCEECWWKSSILFFRSVSLMQSSVKCKINSSAEVWLTRCDSNLTIWLMCVLYLVDSRFDIKTWIEKLDVSCPIRSLRAIWSVLADTQKFDRQVMMGVLYYGVMVKQTDAMVKEPNSNYLFKNFWSEFLTFPVRPWQINLILRCKKSRGFLWKYTDRDRQQIHSQNFSGELSRSTR